MFDIRFERLQDIAGIRKVYNSALKTRVEADIVDELRDMKAHIISLVAIEDRKESCRFLIMK